MDTIKIMRAISCKLRDAYEKQNWDDILKIIEVLEEDFSITTNRVHFQKGFRPVATSNLNEIIKERKLIDKIQNPLGVSRLNERTIAIKVKTYGRTEKSFKGNYHK